MKALKVDIKGLFRRKEKVNVTKREGDQYLSLAVSRPSVVIINKSMIIN
jgi:hypothetical protein